MDLSKLPKFSQTPPPPDQTEPPAPAPAQPTMKTEGGATGAKVELFCRCGAPITPGTNFCSHCGANYYEAVGGRGADRGGSEFTGGGMWIEAFLSIAVGLFLMLIAPNGIKYMTSTLMGKPFTPYIDPDDPTQTKKVNYERWHDPVTNTDNVYTYRSRFEHYWSDMCVTSFALALILEGIVMALIRNRWVVLASALLIVGVTILNIWYVGASYTRISPITKQAYGLPLISVLAIIFGVVMAGYQFMLFNELRAAKRR
jgi:hypothetical protein